MTIYHKRVSVGAFAKKGVDIKDGDFITIANEGKQIEGQFGTQDVFMVKLANGEEKNISLNQTSLNNMIDAYGEEAKNWIGKQAKVWLIRSNVQGKIIPVMYISHPQASLDDDGQFSLPAAKTGITPPPAGTTSDEISLDQIPF